MYRPFSNRYDYLAFSEDPQFKNYDWQRLGVLRMIMSPVVLKTKNTFLSGLLTWIDYMVVFALRYVRFIKTRGTVD